MNTRRILKIVLSAAAVVALLAGTAAYFASRWYLRRYGEIGFDSVVHTMIFHARAAEEGQIRSFLHKVVLRTALCWVALCAAFFGVPAAHRRRRVRAGRTVPRWPGRAGWIVAILTSAVFSAVAVRNVGLDRWVVNRAKPSTLYEDFYVDPRDAEPVFPERRRNLICLYIESCETTLLSREQGGAMERGAMPELYELARDNVNFSHDGGVGGWPFFQGAAWTTGAMTAFTAGIPLSIPVEVNTYDRYRDFLPGVRALGDILRDAGYRQALMVGSDASFGGRDKLYGQHGVERVLDVFAAERDGVIQPGFREWWGMRDSILYEWARLEISRMASEPGPFAVTVLTADTHAPDGFRCPLCEDQFAEPYQNCFACASRQAADFLEWLRAQPFWADTTVLVCGDHLAMDPGFFQRTRAGGLESRHVYNCLLNPAPGLDVSRCKNREFSPMDLFPTVLSAIGCHIPGSRLGLGTDLFSPLPTLCERKGTAWLNEEIQKRSGFYLLRFVLKGR